MGVKLELNELGARTRAANQRRAARLLERQKAAGKVALTVWVSAATRARIDAVRHGATLNETAERLLLAGLNTTSRDKPPGTVDTTSVHTDVVVDKDALMNEVALLLEEGLSGNEIARRLNASGRRNSSGKPFIGANLLRDYRAWAKKAGADRTTAPNLCTQGGADFG